MLTWSHQARITMVTTLVEKMRYLFKGSVPSQEDRLHTSLHSFDRSEEKVGNFSLVMSVIPQNGPYFALLSYAESPVSNYEAQIHSCYILLVCTSTQWGGQEPAVNSFTFWCLLRWKLSISPSFRRNLVPLSSKYQNNIIMDKFPTPLYQTRCHVSQYKSIYCYSLGNQKSEIQRYLQQNLPAYQLVFLLYVQLNGAKCCVRWTSRMIHMFIQTYFKPVAIFQL